MINKSSIIDGDVVAAYQKDTGKVWREDVEERMAIICSFYDYGFNWNEKGNIVINNEFYEGTFEGEDVDIYSFFGKNIMGEKNNTLWRHYEYLSAEHMVAEWESICFLTNADYRANGQKEPFDWL